MVQIIKTILMLFDFGVLKHIAVPPSTGVNVSEIHEISISTIIRTDEQSVKKIVTWFQICIQYLITIYIKDHCLKGKQRIKFYYWP